MKKTIAIMAALGALLFASCHDFLDETTDKSGSAYIYHMDQLYGLMGSTDLYMFESSMLGAYLTEPLAMTDAVEYSPGYYVYGLYSSMPDVYKTYSWDREYLLQESSMMWTWNPSWDRIYRFNTVLENLDKVVQTTQAVHDQVKGEALFGRAYYHFLLLTQYCLWDDDKPGIGYQDNTAGGVAPARQTVAYTLERIHADLDSAEVALTRAGRTAFDQARNFRPTVPTVQAFRARVALYRGDYETALANATDALEAHNTLVDFKNDPKYTLTYYGDICLMNEDSTDFVGSIPYYSLDDLLWSYGDEAVATYEEAYLPHTTQPDFEGYHPMSEKLYNLFDRENDARWIYFYTACNPLIASYMVNIDEDLWVECIYYPDWQHLKPWNCHNYSRFTGAVIGMTTAEMYLIKAECEARAGNTAAAAEDLKTLRRTRFMDNASAEAIGGSVQEVLDERFRELGAVWRFFDLKRLNGAEDAGIVVRREILTDPTDINSVTTLEIQPDDPRYALPIYPVELSNMDWEQNEGWE